VVDEVVVLTQDLRDNLVVQAVVALVLITQVAALVILQQQFLHKEILEDQVVVLVVVVVLQVVEVVVLELLVEIFKLLNKVDLEVMDQLLQLQELLLIMQVVEEQVVMDKVILCQVV
jgi:hypothetical protein